MSKVWGSIKRDNECTFTQYCVTCKNTWANLFREKIVSTSDVRHFGLVKDVVMADCEKF